MARAKGKDAPINTPTRKKSRQSARNAIWNHALIAIVTGIVGVVAMVVLAVVAWVRRDWSVGGRVYYTLLAVVSVALIWWLNAWNLLGWRF